MMRRLYVFIVVLALQLAIPLGQCLRAQGTTASLSTTTCPGNGCVALVLSGGGQGSAHVSGTWVGTLVFEMATLPCSTYAPAPVLPVSGAPVAVSSTTTNGAWFFGAIASQCIRVRFSDHTSGNAQVTLFLGPASSGGTGGGSSAPFAGLTAAELDARLPLPTTAAVTASVDTTGLATATGQTAGNASLTAINGKLPALSNGRVPVTCDNCAGGGGSVGLTDTELRAAPLAVTGTFYPATQPISGSVSVSNFPGTQPVSGTVTATGPLTDTQLRASAVPVSGTFFQTTQPVSIASMPSTPVTGTFWQATQPVSGSLSVSNFPATQAVRSITDTTRTAIALTYTSAAPTVADTVVTTLVKNSAGVAAAGAQSIVATGGKTLRLTAANAQIRTTTAALPWALVTLRMSNTTTCTAASSVVAYLAQGGTAAAIGNVGQFATQFPDGFELSAGGSFCISVSGNVATNVLTFSAQAFEY